MIDETGEIEKSLEDFDDENVVSSSTKVTENDFKSNDGWKVDKNDEDDKMAKMTTYSWIVLAILVSVKMLGNLQ